MDAVRGGTTLALYSSKLGLDIVSSTNFCSNKDLWWCGISSFFTALPSVIVNIYLLYLLHDKSTFINVYKKVLLCMVAFLQILPFAWLVWSLVFLCGSNSKGIEDIRKTTLAILSLQGILECVPQLCLQSYVVMKQYQNLYYPNQTNYIQDAVFYTSADSSILDDWRYIVLLVNLGIGLILVTYAISAAASYSSGEDEEDDQEEGALELVIRIALYLFPFIGVGTRVFICGVLGTYNPGFWFIPVCSALLASAVCNYFLKKDKTWDERILDSLFNTTGNFLTKSSIPASFAYFASATVIFALYTDDPLCISAFSLGLICFLINTIMAALQHFLK